jgi:hypothetical protein
MPERDWKAMLHSSGNLPQPLLTSTGKGPEGDATLVLVRAEVP